MIKIYGKPGCQYCVKATNLAKIKNIDHVYYTLDVDYTREDLLQLVPNARTLPQIFDGDVLIGGFSEFSEFVDGGKNDD